MTKPKVPRPDILLRGASGRRAGMRAWVALLGVAAVLLMSRSAHAEGPVLPTWELGIGGTAFVQPDYPGSDEYRLRGLGFPWFIYRGERVRLTREAIQGRIFRTDRVRLDLSVYGQLPVDSDKNDRRDGMPDLDWRAQVGPNLRILLGQSDDGLDTLRLDLPVRAVFAVDLDDFSYQGYTSSPKLRYRMRRPPWRFETQFGLEFTDRDYNDYIYAVDERFATPDRPAYDADGGYAGTRVAAGVSRYWGDFYLGLFVNYTNLEGAVFHDSPLVGSRHAVTGGFALAWIPLRSASVVPVGRRADDADD